MLTSAPTEHCELCVLRGQYYCHYLNIPWLLIFILSINNKKNIFILTPFFAPFQTFNAITRRGAHDLGQLLHALLHAHGDYHAWFNLRWDTETLSDVVQIQEKPGAVNKTVATFLTTYCVAFVTVYLMVPNPLIFQVNELNGNIYGTDCGHVCGRPCTGWWWGWWWSRRWSRCGCSTPPRSSPSTPPASSSTSPASSSGTSVRIIHSIPLSQHLYFPCKSLSWIFNVGSNI